MLRGEGPRIEILDWAAVLHARADSRAENRDSQPVPGYTLPQTSGAYGSDTIGSWAT
jgi:hypothetical protein